MPATTRRWGPAWSTLVLIAACHGSDPAGGEVDARAGDAAVIDGAPVDGGVIDAAAIDARAIDARPVDAAVDAMIDAPAHVFVGAGPFAGSWLCQYTATTSFTSPVPTDVMSNGVDFIDVGDGAGQVHDVAVTVDGPTGPCTLEADRVGGQATFVPGQQCQRVEQGAVITFTLASGHGDAVAGTLILDLDGPVSGTMGMTTVAGTLTTEYQCVGN